MARDAELDRLGTAQELAFQRKQSAYQAQDAAWQRRSRARHELNQAREEKRSAYAVQDISWQAYLQVRSYNRPRIDQLYSQQELAFQNMKAAFGRASSAYDMRDYASARSHADEGHSYKAEAQGYVAERRGLDQEIRNARDRHEATKLAFQRAKENCSLARRAFDQAKAVHECAQAEFIRVKADCDQAVSAFHQRLEVVRAEAQRKRDEKRAIAERAGVPLHYCDNVWLSTKPDGRVNIYFGGIGEPDGPGHGHYAVDKYGNVTYRRDPFNPHGAHNFTDFQRDYYDVIAGEAINDGEFGFQCRFRGYDALVESSYSRDGRPKIDIYYGPNGPLGSGHHHAVAYRETPYEFVSDKLRG
ncbi:MAG TPA: hypothetical protein VFZ58_00170 [Candidatus Saccharimonadales bacterium]